MESDLPWCSGPFRDADDVLNGSKTRLGQASWVQPKRQWAVQGDEGAAQVVRLGIRALRQLPTATMGPSLGRPSHTISPQIGRPPSWNLRLIGRVLTRRMLRRKIHLAP
jgi:hypothetical protein